MILSKIKNKSLTRFWVKVKEEPYLQINMILAGVILLIFVYSVIFSPEKDNYPLPCIHEKMTGEPCISCGISHSFSLLIRGRIEEAFRWNIYGLRIFLFFVLQLVMRALFSIFFLRNIHVRTQLIIMDISGSAAIFLIAFYPYIEHLFSELF
jgi:hypothetical protein